MLQPRATPHVALRPLVLAGLVLCDMNVSAADAGPAVAGQSEQDKTALRVYTIQGQDLGDALRQFAMESGADVSFDPARVRGLKSKGVSGRYAPQEALRILLVDTGLSFLPKGSGFTISQQSGHGGASPPDAGEARLDSVVIFGSRLTDTDVAGPLPTITITRQQIERSGQSTIAGLLNTLPQVSTNVGETTFETASGQTTVRLHGLPLGTTLVLLNGRRVQTG